MTSLFLTKSNIIRLFYFFFFFFRIIVVTFKKKKYISVKNLFSLPETGKNGKVAQNRCEE